MSQLILLALALLCVSQLVSIIHAIKMEKYNVGVLQFSNKGLMQEIEHLKHSLKENAADVRLAANMAPALLITADGTKSMSPGWLEKIQAVADIE